MAAKSQICRPAKSSARCPSWIRVPPPPLFSHASLPACSLCRDTCSSNGLRSRRFRGPFLSRSGRIPRRQAPKYSGHLGYSAGEKLDAGKVYKDEIDPELLDAIALAGARFDWILKQLGA